MVICVHINRVIIYDRFGYHREYLEGIMSSPGLSYYPYTVFTLANPVKYSDQYAANQVS
jgi:hypothetical protein